MTICIIFPLCWVWCPLNWRSNVNLVVDLCQFHILVNCVHFNKFIFKYFWIVVHSYLLSIWSHHFENFTITTMTWLTATENLCKKLPPLSQSRSFLSYDLPWVFGGVCVAHRFSFLSRVLCVYCFQCLWIDHSWLPLRLKNNTTGTTSGTGTGCLSWEPEFTSHC